MKKINIQFYALPDELIELVQKWRKDFDNLRLVAMKLFPETETWEVKSHDERISIKFDRDITIFLGLKSPSLDVKNKYDFMQKNPDFISLDLGRITPSGLEESWFAGKTTDAELLSTWKKLAQYVKAITKSGLWAVNTEIEGKRFLRNFRYTDAAAKFSQEGGKLLTDGSFVYLTVNEPR